jgi:metal-dependent amidase/aminoacylase/carboxypeptidase family protein
LNVHGRAFARIAAFHPEITALRRNLHAHPALGFEEVNTARRVQQALTLYGVDAVHTGIGKTGVVAVIKGRSQGSGKMIGLRADMDALPMHEHNDMAWKSVTPGLMHGCGHDGHTAMLVGTVRTFKAEVQALIERRLGELCGATAVVSYERMYPATINTAVEAQFAGDVAQSLVGAANVVRDLEPGMGAEDFRSCCGSNPALGANQTDVDLFPLPLGEG